MVLEEKSNVLISVLHLKQSDDVVVLAEVVEEAQLRTQLLFDLLFCLNFLGIVL